MNKQLKKKACRLSAITLSFLLGTTCILGDTLFSISAEDTSMPDTIAEQQNQSESNDENSNSLQDVNDSEDSESGNEEKNQIQTNPEEDSDSTEIPTDDKTGLEDQEDLDSKESMSNDEKTSEEEEPEVRDEIPVFELETYAASATTTTNGTTRFSVVDTKGASLNVPGLNQLEFGWVRNQFSHYSDVHIDNNNYSYYQVLVDNKPVLYLQEYGDNNDIYYSQDGLVGKKLEGGQSFTIEFWKYYSVNVNAPFNNASIVLNNESLKFAGSSVEDLVNLEVLNTQLSQENNSVRVYEGNQLTIEVSTNPNPENDSRYAVNVITLNGSELSETILSSLKYHGTANISITQDSELNFNIGNNQEVKITVQSDAIKDGLQVEKFSGNKISNEYKFSVETENKKNIESLYLIDVYGKSNEVDLPKENGANKAKNTKIGNYDITISRTEFGLGLFLKNYRYDFTIKSINEKPIYDDLLFDTTSKDSSWVQGKITFNSNQVVVGRLNNSNIANVTSDSPIKLDNNRIFFYKGTFFFKAKKGYKINDYTIGEYITSELTGTTSDLSDEVKELALKQGYTHYSIINVGSEYLGKTLPLTIISGPRPVKVNIEVNGKVEENSTDITKNDEFKLPIQTKPDQKLYGYILNGNSEKVYEPETTFTVNESNWDLGQLDSVGNQVFNFTPVFSASYLEYTINYILQNKDGGYSLKESKTSAVLKDNGLVVGIPKPFENYIYNSEKSRPTNSIDLNNPGENPTISLYYDQNFKKVNLDINEETSGKLADKTKKFEYRITATIADKNPEDEFYLNPLLQLPKDWKTDEQGNKYFEFILGGDDLNYVLPDLPSNNCVYKIEQLTRDSKYNTSVNGNSGYSIELNEPEDNKTISFLNTSKDVVVAGIGFNNSDIILFIAISVLLAFISLLYIAIQKNIINI